MRENALPRGRDMKESALNNTYVAINYLKSHPLSQPAAGCGRCNYIAKAPPSQVSCTAGQINEHVPGWFSATSIPDVTTGQGWQTIRNTDQCLVLGYSTLHALLIGYFVDNYNYQSILVDTMSTGEVHSINVLDPIIQRILHTRPALSYGRSGSNSGFWEYEIQ